MGAELKLAVTVEKTHSDGLGEEQDQPVAELIDVGVVDEAGAAVHIEKQWFRTRESEVVLVLDTPPVKAGIDPLNELVDRNPGRQRDPRRRGHARGRRGLTPALVSRSEGRASGGAAEQPR
jgi:hypothetical protein